MKGKGDCIEIRLICNFFDIDPCKECSILNELFEQYNISYYGFTLLSLTTIRSVKNSYDSTFVFKSSRL